MDMVSGKQVATGPRARGDPPADAYVAQALGNVAPGRHVQWLKKQVSTLREDGAVPKWAKPWMHGSDPSPPGLDADRLAAGQGVFNDWCLLISICLFCGSLPKAYAAKDGVQVLARMSQLNQANAVGTRIGNTGRMLLEITALEGLADGAPGRKRLRRVRLLHATARALVELNQQPIAWSSRHYGVPINQEDQFGTLLSFSLTVVDALRAMGIKVSPREEEDYLYLWSVVGWHLGTEAPGRLQLPAQARVLQDALEKKVFGHTSEGVRLMALLLDDMRGTMPRVLAGMPEALVERLAGPRVAKDLDVQASRTWRILLAALATLCRVVMSVPGGKTVLTFPSRRWGRKLISGSGDARRLSERRRTPGPRAAASRPLHATR